MPTVSIVLPTYNGVKYLKESIESVLHQTFNDFELIIVDDCSTDDTLIVANDYAKKDSRIKIIHNEINKKLPESLNIGFREAKGEYLTWTSDDNIMKPDMLETLVSRMKDDHSLGFVYGDIIPIDEKGKIMVNCGYINGEVDDIYVRNPFSACFMYTREVYEAVGEYKKETFLYEDYDYWIRIYEAGFGMFHIKKKMYYYRFHEGSLTSTKRESIDKNDLELLKKHLIKEKRSIQREKIKERIEHIEYELNQNHYNRNKEDWLDYTLDVMAKWLTLKQEKKTLAQYFEKRGYHNVAIYGCRRLGECIAQELKNTGVDLLYGVDKDRDGIYTESYKIYHPDDVLEKVDVLVVTSLRFFEEIKKQMSERMSCPIVSLEEVVRESR